MPKNAKISDLTISRSQVLEYLNCGYRWDLSYRRGIASTKMREAMDLGSAVHLGVKHAVRLYAKGGRLHLFAAVQTGCAEWAKNERDIRGVYLTDEHRDQILEIQREAVGIALKGLENIRLGDWEVASWEGQPVCEMEFVTACPPWKGYRVIPDLVARRRSEGKKAPWWMIDWKCRSSFDEDDAEEINLQFATMQYVLGAETDLKIAGSILWQIKSQAPRRPTQNKNGEMSRAAIVTDWPTYCAALKDAKLDPADYEDMREKLEQVKWYSAIKQHRSIDECESTWGFIIMPAAERMAKDPQVIRRFSYVPFCCRGCWAKEFCLAELRGDDTEFLLETDYMDTRKPRKAREIGDARKTFTLT